MTSLLAGLTLPTAGRRREHGATGALGDVVIVAPGAISFTPAPHDGGRDS